MPWTTSDIPDQAGRIALITGANSGIGLETAKALVAKGATVVLACRNAEKAEGARQGLGSADRTHVMALDLASLASIESFASAFGTRFQRLDLLVNNAGVMIPPLSRTAEGFELQFGTNHLGHFALTGRLMPLLRATPGSRIVSVSSNAARSGSIDFDDPNWERKKYRKITAYSQSKLANLLFTWELKSRLGGSHVLPVSAHPGWTASNLARTAWWFDIPHRIFGQSTEMGALPTLRAAVDPAAQPGDYFGPEGSGQIYGHPVKVEPVPAAKDADTARRLFELSEKLTGVRYSA